MKIKSVVCRCLKAIKFLLSGNSSQRHRVKQELAYRAANLLGDFPFSDGPQAWRKDDKFLKDYEMLSPNKNFSSDRKYMLRELMNAVDHLEGDIVECGSYQGASAYFFGEKHGLKGTCFRFV